jgi:hypothetical protein
MTLTDELKSVLALSEKASASPPWVPLYGASLDDIHFIAAAINLIRRPDFAVLVANARRYEWLRETNQFKHYVDGELVRVDKIDNDIYDAAVDAAIADADAAIAALDKSKP